MKIITFIRKNVGLRYLFFILILIQQSVNAQSIPVYATTINSQDHVDFASNATDNNLATRARVRANSGLVAGLGSYSGHLELQFPALLPANTTSFVKIQTDDELLPSLLGGSLGNLLSGVLGTALIGNQEITVQAKNENSVVLQADSQVSNDFANPRMRIVVNAANEYFIALTPALPYNRIRLTNRLGSLIGLNNTKNLDIYGAYYIGTPDVCGGASYTSFDGSGLNLDLLGLGGAGVSNPHYTLDSNPNNFSRLSLGILAVAASVEQTLYFDGVSQPTDQFFIRMKIDPSLLALGVANNIQIVASNGPVIVQTVNLNSLLNLDLLTLLQGNLVAVIPFSPNGTVNRITVRYNSLLNVQLTQSLDLYSITRAPAKPVISDPFTLNPVICSGSSASLVATTGLGTQLNWYGQPQGGSLLATTNSDQPYVTPALTENTSFYVSAKRIGCPEESQRVKINVTVINLPVASDIVISSPLNACNGAIVLSPSSLIGGAVFKYYKDQLKTQEITTGFSGDPGVTYTKNNATGELSISGLTALNSPYTYYISLTVNGICENQNNTLKAVIVNYSSALSLNVLTTIEGCGSVNLKDAIINFDNSSDIQYNFYDGNNSLLTATAAANIQASGTYYIQATSIIGSCSSAMQQVIVTVNPQPVLTISNANLVVNLGTSVTLEATSNSSITWFDPAGNALPSNVFGPFTTAGFYTFTAIAANGNCTAIGNVSVTVIDPANCPVLTERAYANSQSWSSILTGGVLNANAAIDSNPQTFSTITTGIGLLGIGTTWQTLQWNQTIAAGTPVTVKLGSAYSGLIVAGAYSVVGTKRNSSGIPIDIGSLRPVSGRLADLLPGENTFEFTFVPSDNTGPKNYDGVRIIVGSLVSVAQNVKVYEVYYDKMVTQVTCSADDFEDVFSGVVDLGVGVATATVGVENPFNAVDNSANSYAAMYSGAGILAVADLTVSFRTPTLPGDSLQLLLSRPSTLLNLNLLAGLTIQFYRGNTPVGAPIANTSSLLSLSLLDGGARARLTVGSQSQSYDRIRIRFGGVAGVLDELRVHDIQRKADTSVIGADPTNTIEVCQNQTIQLSIQPEACTTYIWYDAAIGGNVVSTGRSYTVPSTMAAGTYTYYIQPVRYGCETYERGEVTIVVGQTAPPTSITGIQVNGGSITTFCSNSGAINLTAMLTTIATITNPVFHWYSFDGTNMQLIPGENTATLTLTGLAAGAYTYYVGISSDEYCETAPADRATISITILPFSQPSDITVQNILICQSAVGIVTPSSTVPNAQFSWFFTNDNSQPIVSGSVIGGIGYTISPTGILTVSGLTIVNSPYTYYVGLTSDASCLNENGNFKPVTVTVNDSGTPTTNDTSQDFCLSENPVVANIQVNEPNVIWYDIISGGLPLSPATTLVSGATYYAGFDASTGCGSAIRLAVTITINDAPAPTTNNIEQEFCVIDNPTIAAIQVNEPGVIWYLAPGAGTPLPSTTALVNGTTYFGAFRDAISGCESATRLAVAVTINDTDTPTTNSMEQNFCLTEQPTIADIQVNETGAVWYNAATGGTIVPSTAALTDNTTYYAALTDAISGCESSMRLTVTVHVNDSATPTTNNTSQDFCLIDNPTIAAIQVNESNVIWYNQPTGGIALASTDMLTNAATYFASLTDPINGCESSVRLAVTVNINDGTTPTTSNTTQGFCLADNPTVADIEANEANVIWYNAATGGTAYAATDLLLNGAVYYGAVVSANGCESSVRLAVAVNVNNPDTPTTNTNPQNFCLITNPTIADIQVNEINVIWYAAATGGVPLAPTTVLSNGTYYATTSNNSGSCESAIRLAVTVIVNDAATPTTNDTSQDFCIMSSPTIANIQVNELNVIWYNAPAGGTALASTEPLINGTVYFASLINPVNGCESAVRLAVTINIIDVPTPTTNDTSQDFCVIANPTIANLQVNEPNVVWYTAATGGTALSVTDLLLGNTTYYAALIVNGCESPIRLAVTVNLIAIGTPTTNAISQSFCRINNPTIAAIQVNETGVIWYSAAIGGTPLDPNSGLTNGTYYASFNGIGLCESILRLAITVTVNDTATPTTSDTSQEFCFVDAPTIASLMVNEANVLWYATPTAGTPLAVTAPLTAGTYYAAAINAITGCESSIRLAVTVSFRGTFPATLQGGNPQVCAFDQVTYTTESGRTNYTWSVVNGTIISGGQAADNTVTVSWTSLGAASVSVSYADACSITTTAIFNLNVRSCSDITITKTVDNPTPSIDANVVFTITVTNTGAGQFTDVAVTELLPSGYAFVNATASAGVYNNVSGIWNIPQLITNQAAILHITVKVLATGNYLNTASINVSNPEDSDVGNNSAEAFVTPLCLIVYNEFSPNNDGNNDVFRIDCIENYPNNKFEVYNRYGALVFSKNHYANDWDGTANVSGAINKDDQLPTGTYYYILNIGVDYVEPKTGWLSIIR